MSIFATGPVEGVIVDGLAAMAEGGTRLVSDQPSQTQPRTFVWRLAVDGSLVARYGPIARAPYPSGLVALRGGAFAFVSLGEDGAIIQRAASG